MSDIVTLAEAETRLGLTLPARHRQAMLDPADPIHEACDFLVPDSPYELLRWVGVNEFLRLTDTPDPWPAFLVAFASNGCGDHFAYDRRTDPPLVRYMDPDRTVDENLAAALTYPTFDEWYAASLRTHAEVRRRFGERW